MATKTEDHGRARSQKLMPLEFPERQKDMSCFYDENKDEPIPCLVCSREFNGGSVEARDHQSSTRQHFLHHLFTEHKIVIHQTSHIASFKCYASYWKERFSSESGDIAALLPVIQTNPDCKKEQPQKFFLLSDAQTEDKQLRDFLQKTRLEALLELQQSERSDTNFKRSCLFCHEMFIGNRSVLFDHFLQAHHFNIGQPDNIVMVEQFLNLLQCKLDNLQCLYCEKMFKDHVILRDHMRKKQHKRINPNNKSYDKFYMINYLEPGKSWEDVMKEEDEHPSGDTSGNGWSDDWIEPLTSSCLTCLFCSHTSPSVLTFNLHMIETHQFDFVQLTQKMDYYSKIKAINYIRRQVYNSRCIHCCHGYQDVLSHMSEECHFMLPDERTVWDQLQYLFPTYENDELLCTIDDEDEH